MLSNCCQQQSQCCQQLSNSMQQYAIVCNSSQQQQSQCRQMYATVVTMQANVVTLQSHCYHNVCKSINIVVGVPKRCPKVVTLLSHCCHIVVTLQSNVDRCAIVCKSSRTDYFCLHILTTVDNCLTTFANIVTTFDNFCQHILYFDLYSKLELHFGLG